MEGPEAAARRIALIGVACGAAAYPVTALYAVAVALAPEAWSLVVAVALPLVVFLNLAAIIYGREVSRYRPETPPPGVRPHVVAILMGVIGLPAAFVLGGLLPAVVGR